MTATIQLVITLTATDRPGIVDTLAQTVTRFNGNWLESRMANLAGQFAGILLVSLPAEDVDGFLDALNALKSEGISATCENSTDAQPGGDGRCQIELIGSDRPGIVKQLGALLKTHHVNVERLDTTRESGSMSGTPLFTAHALVTLPDELNADDLTRYLETLSADLQVTLERQ